MPLRIGTLGKQLHSMAVRKVLGVGRKANRVASRIDVIGKAAALLFALILCSCSTSTTPTVPSSQVDQRIPSAATSDLNQARLKALWDKRTAKEAAAVDYPIGVGDVITVSVPGVDDLKERTVRVSGADKIELPLVGNLDVGGLTESGLRDKIKQALQKYMYDPQVDVFVKEYHSRQVAVVGAVRAPGLVTLSGPGETILDVITQAGGMTADAADEIVILPEVKGSRADLNRVASSFMTEHPAATPNADASLRHEPGTPAEQSSSDLAKQGSSTGITTVSIEPTVDNGPAVVIPLKSNALQGSLTYTNLPVAPGDILVVPGGGNVMVTGWVQRPGFFAVGSGLTVLGAVGSAGGVMYAANPSDTTLMRSDNHGNKVAIPINLDKISTGAEPDIPVRANDVIDVPYSSVKIGPYVVYNILSKMTVPVPAY
jgi:polysaccharide biosynthesis/export protein